MSDKIQKSETTAMQQTAVTPMTLIAAAQASNSSIEQMSQLLELQMRWEENEARKAYNDAFSRFKEEQFQIFKDSTVDFTFNGKRTYYKHTSLAHIVDTVVPLLAKHGLSHAWETTQKDGQIAVTCKVSHRDGHSESITLSGQPDTGAGKNSIQAIGSTVTYLQRYTLMSILGLASSDVDDDGRISEERDPDKYLSEMQIAEVFALITEVGADEQAFLDYLGYDSLADVPRTQYQRAIKALEGRRK